MNNKTTGNYGEELACKYLGKLGYRILERNFRIRGGEVDIVCKDKDQIIFVEVKTRHTHEFGEVAEAITPWKIKFIARTAQFYLLKHKLIDHLYRIDVITLDLTSGEKLEHFKNITF